MAKLPTITYAKNSDYLVERILSHAEGTLSLWLRIVTLKLQYPTTCI